MIESLMVCEKKGHATENSKAAQNGEGDFDPAQGVFAGNGAGVAVDDDLEMLGGVIVGEEPDGDEDVLECLAAVIALDLQVALCVARDLGGA